LTAESVRMARALTDDTVTSRRVPRSRAGRMFRLTVFGLFLCTLALSVYLVRWSIASVPVRGMVAISILLLIAMANIEIVFNEIRRFRFLLTITVVVAAIGVISSLSNGSEMTNVGRQILEIHIQAFVNIIVGACVARICGLERSVLALVAVVGVSSVFALLQFIGFTPAYEARNFLSGFQPAELDGDSGYFALAGRARGLSYTSVHLGTQVCLVFAAAMGLLLHKHGGAILDRLDPRVLLVASAVAVASVASGNRSPVLGIIIFLVVYVWLIRTKFSAVVFALFGLTAILFVDQMFFMLQEAGLRVGTTEDSSAVSRIVLLAYGMLLFLEQPFGYGLDFNSMEHAGQYLGVLRDFEYSDRIARVALHNYYLLMLNKYGALILIVGALCAGRMLRNGLIVVAFIPYMVHIFYHNDGPYQADFLIWFVIPVLSRIGTVSWRRDKWPQRTAFLYAGGHRPEAAKNE
jgi:O-Antigen ligase